MAARIFLALSALIWLSYGLLCFFRPAGLAESAGVSFTSATGATELRAMYGGLQAAIGAMALFGVLRPARESLALSVLLVACAGLGVARLAGAGLDGEVSSYTAMALVLELGSVAFVVWLRRRRPALAG